MISPDPALKGAIRLGFAAAWCISLAMLWAFFGPSNVMFGVAEGLALLGMLMGLSAAWKAADATSERQR